MIVCDGGGGGGGVCVWGGGVVTGTRERGDVSGQDTRALQGRKWGVLGGEGAGTRESGEGPWS